MPGTSILLDREIAFAEGEEYTFSFVTPAGELREVPVFNPGRVANRVSTLTEIAEADLPLANSVWGISSTSVQPRQFRIMAVKETREGGVEIAALEHRSEKFSAIDGGVLLPDADGAFSDLGDPSVVPPPGIPQLSFITRDTPTGRRGVILVQCTPATSVFLRGYQLTYQIGFDNFVTLPESAQPLWEILDPRIDVVRVVVQSVSIYGNLSNPVAADLDLRTGGAFGKSLVSNIRVRGGGGFQWTGRDIHIEWDANSPYSETTGRNDGVDPFFKRFRIRVKNPAGGAVIATLYSSVPNVVIPYELLAGTLLRAYDVGVSIEDVKDVFSTETTVLLSNPAPGLTGVTVTEGMGTAAFAFGDSNDADYRGIILWVSDVSGFTPGPSNEVWRGLGGFIYNGPPGVTRYYRYAAYDAFGDTGLTISAQGTFDIGLVVIEDLDYTVFASSITPVGIVAALPTVAGYAGPPVVFNTTDGQLYRLTGGAWTRAVPAAAITGEITGTQIANDAITTPKIAANAITADELAANSVIAGKIAAAAVSATEIATGAITTEKIGANQVTSDKILANAVTAGKIAAGSITADRMNVTSLSAISANLGAITAGSLNINGKFIVASDGTVTIQNAASGQRLTISNSVLQVYDASNVLRVRLGIW